MWAHISSSYLHDRKVVRSGAGALASVRSGAEIDLLSLLASQGVSLRDFRLTPECPIEKVNPFESALVCNHILHLISFCFVHSVNCLLQVSSSYEWWEISSWWLALIGLLFSRWLSLIGCPNAKMIVKLDDDIMIHLERFHLVWEKVTKNMLISDSFVMGKRKTCFCAKNMLQYGMMLVCRNHRQFGESIWSHNFLLSKWLLKVLSGGDKY